MRGRGKSKGEERKRRGEEVYGKVERKIRK